MIIRPTTEKHNGFDVVLMGKSADKLGKYYLQGEEMIPVPVTMDTARSQCRMHYEKDGKVWFTQVGESHLSMLKSGNVAGIHRVKTGKQEHDYFVLWTENNGKMFPKYKVPLDEVREGMSALEA
jgi:hypothetical protein